MRILYFDLDAICADHLGIYGYNRKTSPVIDALATRSAVFNHCYASDAPCLPSRAALFSCRPGIANGVVSHEAPGMEFRFPSVGGMGDHDTANKLPMRLLQENGYHTVTFSIFAQRHNAWWFNAGFSEVSNPTYPSTSEHTDTVTPRLLSWMDNHLAQHEDCFIHINLWDAHTPYFTYDEALRERVKQNPLPAWPDEAAIQSHYANIYGPKTARDIMIRTPNYQSRWEGMPDAIHNRETFAHMCDSYDACIATVDRAVGEVLAKVESLGLREDTAIIISADHGEAIGQLGMYFEHGIAVEPVTRLPLIFHWPGVTESSPRHDFFLYQYDFMATIMDLLDIPEPEGWDAQSFRPALQGEAIAGRPYVVSGCGIFTLSRTVRTSSHAYMQVFHSGCYPYDPEYLWDMAADPWQSTSVLETEPEVADHMRGLYLDWWNRWCSGPTAVADPMHAQIPHFSYFPPERMFDRLKHVDRPDQAADLRARLNALHSAPT